MSELTRLRRLAAVAHRNAEEMQKLTYSSQASCWRRMGRTLDELIREVTKEEEHG